MSQMSNLGITDLLVFSLCVVVPLGILMAAYRLRQRGRGR